MFKKILLGSASGLIIAGNIAFAADMPVKAPRITVPSFGWTGFYAGVNLGYGAGSDPTSMYTQSAAGFPGLGAGTTLYGGSKPFSLASSGLNGGIQAGYNRQHANGWVTGVEADIQGSRMEDSLGCLIACNARATTVITAPFNLFPVVFSDISASHKLEWFGTVRGRVGYAAGPTLFYGTGGLAYGEVERSGSVTGATVGAITGTTVNTFAGSYKTSSILVGWTLGAGAETKLSDRWSAKAEYLYMDLGSVHDNFNTYFLTAGGGAVVGAAAANRTDTTNIHNHVFRFGVNYHMQSGNSAMAALASAAPVGRGPAYNWNGMYAGINLGYGTGRDASTRSSVLGTSGAVSYGGPQQFNVAPDGAVGGGQLGVNWQASNPNWVFGAEADIQGSGLKDGANCIPIACGARILGSTGTPLFPVVFSDFSAQHKLNWFGTLRGRVGYSTGPALFYATGGLAYGEVERSGSIAGRTVGLITNTTFNTFAGTYNRTSVQSGWTIGAGGEMKITDKLTAKAEYLYMDLGHTSDTFATVFTTGATGRAGTHTFTSDFTEHVFRVGMNYKLGERQTPNRL